MAKPHLKFKNFNPQLKAAAEELLTSRPWQGDDKEKQEKFERFLTKASEAYGVPKPELIVDPDSFVLQLARGMYNPQTQTIGMPIYSVTTLFHEFRHHLNACRGADSGEENDVVAWSTSLFYSIRPTLFRKRVREGRIVGVHPRDLLADPSTYVETETPARDPVEDALQSMLNTPEQDA